MIFFKLATKWQQVIDHDEIVGIDKVFDRRDCGASSGHGSFFYQLPRRCRGLSHFPPWGRRTARSFFIFSATRRESF